MQFIKKDFILKNATSEAEILSQVFPQVNTISVDDTGYFGYVADIKAGRHYWVFSDLIKSHFNLANSIYELKVPLSSDGVSNELMYLAVKEYFEKYIYTLRIYCEAGGFACDLNKILFAKIDSDGKTKILKSTIEGQSLNIGPNSYIVKKLGSSEYFMLNSPTLWLNNPGAYPMQHLYTSAAHTNGYGVYLPANTLRNGILLQGGDMKDLLQYADFLVIQRSKNHHSSAIANNTPMNFLYETKLDDKLEAKGTWIAGESAFSGYTFYDVKTLQKVDTPNEIIIDS